MFVAVVPELWRHRGPVAREQRKMLAEIEPGGEPRTGAGQHDRVRVVAFEPTERLTADQKQQHPFWAFTGFVVIVTTATRPGRSIVQLILSSSVRPTSRIARAC